MNKKLWEKENLIGSNLFKSPNNYKRDVRYRKIQQEDCCELILRELRSVGINRVSGYKKLESSIITFNYFIPDTEIDELSIMLPTCYHEVHLYFYKEKDIFYCKNNFTFCTAFDLSKIDAFKLNVFNINGDPEFNLSDFTSISISCKVINLKNLDKYHFKTGSQRALPFKPRDFKVTLPNFKCIYLPKYFCIFCFIKYDLLTSLINHINISHLYYKAEVYERFELQILRNNVEDQTVNFYNNEINYIKNSQFEIKTKAQFEKFSLKKFELPINEEFDLLDTVQAIGYHLNKGLSNYKLNLEEERIMKKWNILSLKALSPINRLRILIKEFSISEEVIKLIDILFSKGVLTSSEILALIKE